MNVQNKIYFQKLKKKYKDFVEIINNKENNYYLTEKELYNTLRITEEKKDEYIQ